MENNILYRTYFKYLVVVMFTTVNFLGLFLYFSGNGRSLLMMAFATLVFILVVPAIAALLEILGAWDKKQKQ